MAAASSAIPTKLYLGPDIPRRVIRAFARQVAEKFRPEKIILFGSYAYGQPHADSDVALCLRGSDALRRSW